MQLSFRQFLDSLQGTVAQRLVRGTQHLDQYLQSRVVIECHAANEKCRGAALFRLGSAAQRGRYVRHRCGPHFIQAGGCGLPLDVRVAAHLNQPRLDRRHHGRIELPRGSGARVRAATIPWSHTGAGLDGRSVGTIGGRVLRIRFRHTFSTGGLRLSSRHGHRRCRSTGSRFVAGWTSWAQPCWSILSLPLRAAPLPPLNASASPCASLFDSIVPWAAPPRRQVRRRSPQM